MTEGGPNVVGPGSMRPSWTHDREGGPNVVGPESMRPSWTHDRVLGRGRTHELPLALPSTRYPSGTLVVDQGRNSDSC